jgi:phosphate transport system substrate-binding protein
MTRLNFLLMATVCLFTLSVATLFVVSCDREEEEDSGKMEIVTVSPKLVLAITHPFSSFAGQAMEIKRESFETYYLPPGGIEGFEYEEGYEYRLKVWVIPPSIDILYPETFKLMEILSKTFVGSEGDGDTPARIEGLTFDSYPRVDGSTSCRHLNEIIACKLLNVSYTWQPPLVMNEWSIHPDYEHIPEAYRDFFWQRIKTSQTHGAFMNLIDGTADLILTHRTMSPDEKAHAGELGVTLTETPVARDAFVFVVNPKNPVRSLTVAQLQSIYTGKTTNWKQVRGRNRNADIKVFTRPRNSGSEEVMRELVMKGLETGYFPESAIGSMAWVFSEVINDKNAICYTFLNYKELIVRKLDSEVSKIAVNGIFPGKETVRNGMYPFIAEVHVAIRSDLNRNSMAYKLYEWLQSPAAHAAITESGYFIRN